MRSFVATFICNVISFVDIISVVLLLDQKKFFRYTKVTHFVSWFVCLTSFEDCPDDIRLVGFILSIFVQRVFPNVGRQSEGVSLVFVSESLSVACDSLF